jgi:hypothetical protein
MLFQAWVTNLILTVACPFIFWEAYLQTETIWSWASFGFVAFGYVLAGGILSVCFRSTAPFFAAAATLFAGYAAVFVVQHAITVLFFPDHFALVMRDRAALLVALLILPGFCTFIGAYQISEGREKEDERTLLLFFTIAPLIGIIVGGDVLYSRRRIWKAGSSRKHIPHARVLQ